MKTRPVVIACALLAAAAALGAAAENRKPGPGAEREFTLGLVQKELEVGMSQTDVAQALGSPNLVTRSGDGREAWVYDKVASEARVRSSGIGVEAGGLGTPGTSLILGLLGAHHRDARSVSSQKTLTVVIRFGAQGSVETFSFHASRF